MSVDKHIKIDEELNERIRESGKTIPELLRSGLRDFEQDELPDWMPGLETDFRTIYRYLKKLEDSDLSRKIIKEIFTEGLDSEHNEMLLKIVDPESPYYVKLCVDSTQDIIAEYQNFENEMERISIIQERSRIEQANLENLKTQTEQAKHELKDSFEAIEFYNEVEGNIRSALIEFLMDQNEMEGERDRIVQEENEKIPELTKQAERLKAEIKELENSKREGLTDLGKELIEGWINNEYDTAIRFVGNDFWDYSRNPNGNNRDQLFRVFRAWRQLCHVTPDLVIEAANKFKEFYPGWVH